ncbi:MAG: hypothetical protein R6W96_05255 [Clostridia bacterium]
MLSIKEVKTRRDLKKFVVFPNRMYRDNPYFVPELVMDDLHTLSKKKNPAFAFSEGTYYMAYDGKKPVGRIGILVNHRSNEKWNQKQARFTHLDFIDDRAVSALLLGTAENWARSHGYDSLHGPMGLTDMDHQGMLIEGFEENDLYITLYNHAYYPEHMESLGYKKDVDYIEYQLFVPDKPLEVVSRIAQRVIRRFNYRLVEFTHKKEILPWAQKIFNLYNDAYSKLYGTSALTQEQIDMYIKANFGFVNPDFIKLVVDKDDQVIGFGITMPSISKALRKARGRLFPFGFIHILKAIRKNDTVDMYLVAIHPDHQGTGAIAILLDSLTKSANRYGITLAETGPELETNLQVQAQWKFYKTRQHRRRRIYLKNLS